MSGTTPHYLFKFAYRTQCLKERKKNKNKQNERMHITKKKTRQKLTFKTLDIKKGGDSYYYYCRNDSETLKNKGCTFFFHLFRNAPLLAELVAEQNLR